MLGEKIPVKEECITVIHPDSPSSTVAYFGTEGRPAPKLPGLLASSGDLRRPFALQ